MAISSGLRATRLPLINALLSSLGFTRGQPVARTGILQRHRDLMVLHFYVCLCSPTDDFRERGGGAHTVIPNFKSKRWIISVTRLLKGQMLKKSPTDKYRKRVFSQLKKGNFLFSFFFNNLSLFILDFLLISKCFTN